MTIYGLTGGIATGKSTLATMMQQVGWTLVDSDAIAHRLMEPGQVNWKNVVDAFGDKILNLDSTINRRALGEIVFSQPTRRHQLNALTHPAIRDVWQGEIRRFSQAHPAQPMVVIIPLLFECHYQEEFDAVIGIGCLRATQIKRMLSRGLSQAQADKRLASQLPVSDKLNASQLVFWNEGSLDTLRRQFQKLIDR